MLCVYLNVWWIFLCKNNFIFWFISKLVSGCLVWKMDVLRLLIVVDFDVIYIIF